MPITFNEPSYFVEARGIADRVPMSHLLEVFGFTVNNRSRRCACMLHRGSNPSAFTWTEPGLWNCYGCGAGGDKISLVRTVRKCSFADAVGFLAALAGVELSNAKRSYAEIEQSRRRREAEKRSARLLAETQHNLYLELGRELDSLRRLGRKVRVELAAGRRSELCWFSLKFVADTLPYVDTAYCIAAFAPPLERARFALFPDQRLGMITAALERGYVNDAKGQRFEVSLQ